MRLPWRERKGTTPWLRPLGGAVAVCLLAVAIGSGSLGKLVSQVAHLGTSHQEQPASTGPDFSPSGSAGPTSPPVRVCGNNAIVGQGPTSPPARAIIVRAGDNGNVNWSRSHATYWFAPGVHTLGAGQYTQIIPGSGSRYVGAPGAVIDGQHANFYAFGGDAPGVTISYLTVRNFGQLGGNQNEGVVNQDSASNWTVDHSTVRDNAGAGIMLGSGDTLTYDCLERNQQYGFNAYSPNGPDNLTLDHNEIADNDTYNWESRQPGCGCSGGGKFWDVTNATITSNWVHGNSSVGLWADTNNQGFEFSGNYISENYAYGLIYEISYNALIQDNTFVRNGLGAGPKNAGFPTSAIYISESGADSRVHGRFSNVFRIVQNTFIDNWGGVILWENSNRFCNSPSNTSSGVCTLVAPNVATIQSCNSHDIARQPYYDDCRWKTQNVQVAHNTFDFDPDDLGQACTTTNECGFQGVFSEYGTYPSWSPYTAHSVEDHITYGQNNQFSANLYNGPWEFMAHEQGNVVSWSQWRANPYNQDNGSRLKMSDG